MTEEPLVTVLEPDRFREKRPGGVLDLRGGAAVRELGYPAGDVVVVSGLPGSGKSTLMRRTVSSGPEVFRIDSQDVRQRWEARMPGFVPYSLYRPLVRLDHYAGLWRALRSGVSVLVHDCGSLVWVRRWIARDARRRGRGMHLLLLDVPERAAREGQRSRGRGVSAYAMARHRVAARRLVAAAEGGRLPVPCVSTVLLDRHSTGVLERIAFER